MKYFKPTTPSRRQMSVVDYSVLTKDKKLAVQTGKGLLMIEILQLEGKKPMPGQEFLKGHQDIINTILE